jgi:hypothetical protein
MNIIWVFVLIAVGLFMTISSITKSKFIIYRLLVARAKLLFKEKAHSFLLVSGILIIIFGMLILMGIIG